MALQTTGINLHIVVCPTSQCSCNDYYVSPVAMSLGVTASFNPTSKQGLRKIGDFLLDGVVYAFLKEVENCRGHPDKSLVTWDIRLY